MKFRINGDTEDRLMAWLASCLRPVAIVLCGFAGLAAWSQTAPDWRALGPAGGSLTALLADPTAPGAGLYAGSDANGVFVSRDAGATWKASNSGLSAGRHVHALAALGNFVYAATDDGVFVSAAGAAPVWTRVQSPQAADPAPACAIRMMISVKNKLYLAADCEPTIYVTSDAGQPKPAWGSTRLPSNLSGLAPNVSALGVLDDTLAVGSVSTVYRLDANQNWVNSEATTDSDGFPILSGLQGEHVAAIVSSSSKWAFTCTAAGLLFQADLTSGAAVTWTRLQFTGEEPSNCNGLAVVRVGAAGQSVVAMASSSGTFASSVFDDSTAAAPNFVPGPVFAMSKQVRAVLQADPAARSGLLWATEFGLYASTVADLNQSTILNLSSPLLLNGPARVDAPSQRLDNVQVLDMAVLGTSLFAIAQSDTGSYADVMVSADRGASWVRTHLVGLATPVAAVRALVADATHNVLYAATDQGVYYLWQGAGAWTLLGNAYDVKALALGSQALYAGRRADGSGSLEVRPLVGTAAAASFAVMQTTPIANFNVQKIVLFGGSVYVAGWQDAAGVYDNAVYVAADFAPSVPAVQPSWRIFGSGPFSSSSRVTSLAVAAGVVFMGGSGFLMQNENGSWGAVTGFSALALEPPVVKALALDTTYLYVGTAEGLWAIGLADRAVKGLVAMNGSGASALPSLVVNGLRVLDGSLYVATAAGLATPALLVPAAQAAGGGGCSMALAGEPDPLLWLLVFIAALQLLYAQRRRKSAAAVRAQVSEN